MALASNLVAVMCCSGAYLLADLVSLSYPFEVHGDEGIESVLLVHADSSWSLSVGMEASRFVTGRG